MRDAPAPAIPVDAKVTQGEVVTQGIRRVESPQGARDLERHGHSGSASTRQTEHPRLECDVHVERDHEPGRRRPTPQTEVDPVFGAHHPTQKEVHALRRAATLRMRHEKLHAPTRGVAPGSRFETIGEGRESRQRGLGVRGISLRERPLEGPEAVEQACDASQKGVEILLADPTVAESLQRSPAPDRVPVPHRPRRGVAEAVEEGRDGRTDGLHVAERQKRREEPHDLAVFGSGPVDVVDRIARPMGIDGDAAQRFEARVQRGIGGERGRSTHGEEDISGFGAGDRWRGRVRDRKKHGMTRPRLLSAWPIAALLLSAFVGAQTPASRPTKATRTAASRPAAAPRTEFPWTLAAPSSPCPSHVPPPTTLLPEQLHGGTSLTLERVVDGDTVRLLPTKESVRLLGLDTEECFKGKSLDSADRKRMVSDFAGWRKDQLAGTNPTRPPKYNTPMGEAAHSALDRIVEGAEEIRVVYDDPRRKVDGFGRVLAHLLVRKGPTWIHANVEMVRQGLSPYFVKYGRCMVWDAAYEAAQAEARSAKRGIWDSRPWNPEDPLARYGSYDDYEVRLAWWAERARDLAKAAEQRKTRDDLYLLGDADEGRRLAEAEGKTVTVFGSHSTKRNASGLVLYGLSHLKDEDFLIVGSASEIAATGIAAQEGNLVWVTGTISIYRGRPQFKIGPKNPIVVHRTWPPAAESRPVGETR